MAHLSWMEGLFTKVWAGCREPVRNSTNNFSRPDGTRGEGSYWTSWEGICVERAT